MQGAQVQQFFDEDPFEVSGPKSTCSLESAGTRGMARDESVACLQQQQQPNAFRAMVNEGAAQVPTVKSKRKASAKPKAQPSKRKATAEGGAGAGATTKPSAKRPKSAAKANAVDAVEREGESCSHADPSVASVSDRGSCFVDLPVHVAGAQHAQHVHLPLQQQQQHHQQQQQQYYAQQQQHQQQPVTAFQHQQHQQQQQWGHPVPLSQVNAAAAAAAPMAMMPPPQQQHHHHHHQYPQQQQQQQQGVYYPSQQQPQQQVCLTSPAPAAMPPPLQQQALQPLAPPPMQQHQAQQVGADLVRSASFPVDPFGCAAAPGGPAEHQLPPLQQQQEQQQQRPLHQQQRGGAACVNPLQAVQLQAQRNCGGAGPAVGASVGGGHNGGHAAVVSSASVQRCGSETSSAFLPSAAGAGAAATATHGSAGGCMSASAHALAALPPEVRRQYMRLHVVPFDLMTSHFVTALGGNPCLELTCKPQRSMWSVLHHLATKWRPTMDAFGLQWGITLLPGPEAAACAPSSGGVFHTDDPAEAQATKVGQLRPTDGSGGGGSSEGSPSSSGDGDAAAAVQLWYSFLPINTGFLRQGLLPSSAASPTHAQQPQSQQQQQQVGSSQPGAAAGVTVAATPQALIRSVPFAEGAAAAGAAEAEGDPFSSAAPPASAATGPASFVGSMQQQCVRPTLHRLPSAPAPTPQQQLQGYGGAAAAAATPAAAAAGPASAGGNGEVVHTAELPQQGRVLRRVTSAPAAGPSGDWQQQQQQQQQFSRPAMLSPVPEEQTPSACAPEGACVTMAGAPTPAPVPAAPAPTPATSGLQHYSEQPQQQHGGSGSAGLLCTAAAAAVAAMGGGGGAPPLAAAAAGGEDDAAAEDLFAGLEGLLDEFPDDFAMDVLGDGASAGPGSGGMGAAAGGGRAPAPTPATTTAPPGGPAAITLSAWADDDSAPAVAGTSGTTPLQQQQQQQQGITPRVPVPRTGGKASSSMAAPAASGAAAAATGDEPDVTSPISGVIGNGTSRGRPSVTGGAGPGRGAQHGEFGGFAVSAGGRGGSSAAVAAAAGKGRKGAPGAGKAAAAAAGARRSTRVAAKAAAAAAAAAQEAGAAAHHPPALPEAAAAIDSADGQCDAGTWRDLMSAFATASDDSPTKSGIDALDLL